MKTIEPGLTRCALSPRHPNPTILPLTSEDEAALNESELAQSSFIENLKHRWKEWQRRRIDKAIATYSCQKHMMCKGYRPIMDGSTLRMATGKSDRNKLPFHARKGPLFRAEKPLQLTESSSKEESKIQIFVPLADPENKGTTAEFHGLSS